MSLPRPEYPRPQFAREEWLNLNGLWWFIFDDKDIGLKQRWYEALPLVNAIKVPFAYQSKLSGIGETIAHDCVWYQRDFQVPREWSGQRILLHFGAVDYATWVWINGQFVTFHEGGHTPFYADITDVLYEENNQLVVRVVDVSADAGQPRGKQHWEPEPGGIFYTRTTGIWQTVWLEPVSDRHLEQLQIIPDVDVGQVHVTYMFSGRLPSAVSVETRIRFSNQAVATVNHDLDRDQQEFTQTIPLAIKQPARMWSPESPALYDMTVSLRDPYGNVIDQVESYFGLRKITINQGKIMLNNQPYYMKLVLDQGYFPDGLLTAPTDEALKRDIELAKAMGFNGVRKHQKIEDPRFLYWADRLGLLVWGEMANAYVFSERTMQRVISEWQAVLRRDYNHPCIVAWVPVNESWGVPTLPSSSRQREHLTTLVHLTKSVDPTRPVISNDGWEHTCSDIVTIHDYSEDSQVLRSRYSTLDSLLAYRPGGKKALFALGYSYRGEPLMISEFGGIAFSKAQEAGWGYVTAVDAQDLIQRYKALVQAILQSPHIQGFCYTQLTDVEQEINGLLTAERQPKADPKVIREINNGPRS